jgi:peptide methionine sulfoxide reductase MsrA
MRLDEDYHQHYFANHPNQGYCAFVVQSNVSGSENEQMEAKPSLARARAFAL